MTSAVAKFIREHARSARPRHEIGGEARLKDGRFIAYEALVNATNEPSLYQPLSLPSPGMVQVHSHPRGTIGHPSRGDIEAMRADGLPGMLIHTPEAAAGEEFIFTQLDPSRPSGVVVFPIEVEPAAGPVRLTHAQRTQIRRSVDFQELIRLAASPLELDAIIETAAAAGEDRVLVADRVWDEQPVDEPDRAGGIAWPDPGEDGVPRRIAEDASPLDLARRTQARRERARRERMPVADRPHSDQAAALPDGVYVSEDGRRRLIVQNALAASAMTALLASRYR
jgi:hypothetical protein